MTVPATRIRALNTQPIHEDGGYVLDWMIGARRLQSNFALQHAVDLACALARPLLVLEPLDVTYPAANDRLHRFVLDGMAANARSAAPTAARYVPYVETAPGAGRGLLRHLAAKAHRSSPMTSPPSCCRSCCSARRGRFRSASRPSTATG